MARKGISQQQVFGAVEALMQENNSVTVSSVRDQLGSGSYSTISTHLAAWRAANDNRTATEYPEIPDTVNKAFTQVWVMAWKEAQNNIQAEREALALARQQMEEERKDMSAEITRLEAQSTVQDDEIKKAADTLSEKIKALSTAQNTLNDLKVENARLDERVKSTEGRAGELKEELGKLHTRLQEATVKPKIT